MDLYSTFIKIAQAHPNRLAIATMEREYSFAELAEWVNNLISGFRRLGLKRGDRIGVLLKNRPILFVLFWVCAAIGAVMVPLNPDNSRQSLNDALEDIEPKAIVYERLGGSRIADLLGPSHPLLIGVDADDADIEVGELPRVFGREAKYRNYQVDEDDVAVILYTTGTTGRPKGVPRTHRNTLAAAWAQVVQNQYESSDRILGVMPLSHTMGLHLYVAATLLCAPYVLVSEFDPDQVATLIEHYRITSLYQMPFWYYTLLQSRRTDHYDFSSVTKIGYAGSVMHADLTEALIDRFRPQVFINHYGSTEVYTHTVGNVLLRIPGSVGKPGINASIHIDGTETPEMVGEVLVSLSSPEAFRGYWNRPELTRKSLSGGWYRTGDLGYRDVAGNFYIVGRSDEMIISGGEHIIPQLVESVLGNHPKVLEVAVTSEPDNRWGQMVVAYVVPRVSTLRVFELDAYCKTQHDLSPGARPRKYVFVRQIPKSATGKILRRELANLEGSL